jgi:hypothetical protein
VGGRLEGDARMMGRRVNSMRVRKELGHHMKMILASVAYIGHYILTAVAQHCHVCCGLKFW